jgi:hypothetical protein
MVRGGRGRDVQADHSSEKENQAQGRSGQGKGKAHDSRQTGSRYQGNHSPVGVNIIDCARICVAAGSD